MAAKRKTGIDAAVATVKAKAAELNEALSALALADLKNKKAAVAVSLRAERGRAGDGEETIPVVQVALRIERTEQL